MFDWFIKIPGLDFLWMYIVFAVVLMFIGHYLQVHDGSLSYTRQKPLNRWEAAVLRDGSLGVAQTALFQMWRDEIIQVTGRGGHTRIAAAGSPTRPLEDVEKTLYEYIKDNGSSKPAVLHDPELHAQLDTFLLPLCQSLTNRRLLRNKKQLSRHKKISFFLFALIFGTGGLKVSFGLWYDRPVAVLVFLMIFLFFAASAVLFRDARASTHGRRRLAELQKQLKRKKTLDEKSADGAVRVAALGFAGLAGWTVFEGFYQTVGIASTTSVSFASGDGDSDGSDGGGGCGGCGGGD